MRSQQGDSKDNMGPAFCRLPASISALRIASGSLDDLRNGCRIVSGAVPGRLERPGAETLRPAWTNDHGGPRKAVTFSLGRATPRSKTIPKDVRHAETAGFR